jgi:hypothetical protein
MEKTVNQKRKYQRIKKPITLPYGFRCDLVRYDGEFFPYLRFFKERQKIKEVPLKEVTYFALTTLGIPIEIINLVVVYCEVESPQVAIKHYFQKVRNLTATKSDISYNMKEKVNEALILLEKELYKEKLDNRKIQETWEWLKDNAKWIAP